MVKVHHRLKWIGRRAPGRSHEYFCQTVQNILEGINELRMTYLEGELEISGKVPIRTESAQSTASGQKNATFVLT